LRKSATMIAKQTASMALSHLAANVADNTIRNEI